MIAQYLNACPAWLILVLIGTTFASIFAGGALLIINNSKVHRFILGISLLAVAAISVIFLATGLYKRSSTFNTIQEKYRQEAYIDDDTYKKCIVYPTYIDGEPTYKIAENIRNDSYLSNEAFLAGETSIVYYDTETKEVFIEEDGEYLPYKRNQKTYFKDNQLVNEQDNIVEKKEFKANNTDSRGNRNIIEYVAIILAAGFIMIFIPFMLNRREFLI